MKQVVRSIYSKSLFIVLIDMLSLQEIHSGYSRVALQHHLKLIRIPDDLGLNKDWGRLSSLQFCQELLSRQTARPR